MRKLLLATAAAGIAAVASPAQAIVITPDSSGLIFTAFAGPLGTLLAYSETSGAALTFSATFRTAVYRDDSTGFLSFFYQVDRTGVGSNTAPFPNDQEIERLTVSDFSGWTVDGFVSGADPDGAGGFRAVNNTIEGPGSTTRVGRNGDGDVVQIAFGSNGLKFTENSATYILRTNATGFDRLGTFGIIDGSTLQGAAFSPAVPEPATWAMMIGGFGLAGVALRRARRPRLLPA